MLIEQIQATVRTTSATLPPKKGKISLGALPTSTSWVSVTISTKEGAFGFGFGDFPQGATFAKDLIEKELAPLLVGQSALSHEKHFAKVVRHFGPLWGGIVARCYSLIDISLWDLKAKAANVPLGVFLGGVRSGSAAMIVNPAPLGTTADAILSQSRASLDAGALGILVPVGSEEPQFDADQVQHLRDELGEGAWLAVDAGERFDLNTSLVFSHFLDDLQADWFANPVPKNDPQGLARLGQTTVVPLAVGSSFNQITEFREVLTNGHARVLRPNPYLLGGLTPLIKICQIAEVFPVSVVPDCPEAIGVHLGCGLASVSLVPVWGSGLPELDGKPVWQNRTLTPNNRPGLGISFENPL